MSVVLWCLLSSYFALPFLFHAILFQFPFRSLVISLPVPFYFFFNFVLSLIIFLSFCYFLLNPFYKCFLFVYFVLSQVISPFHYLFLIVNLYFLSSFPSLFRFLNVVLTQFISLSSYFSLNRFIFFCSFHFYRNYVMAYIFILPYVILFYTHGHLVFRNIFLLLFFFVSCLPLFLVKCLCESFSVIWNDRLPNLISCYYFIF